MKTLRITALLVAGLVLLALALTGPAAATTGSSPIGAPYVDSQTRVIGGNSALWYRFDYAGDHSQVTIKIPLGADNHLAFEVYTSGQMTSWWDTDPVGRGSASGPDLLWSGNSHAGGAYFIKVVNNSLHAAGFQVEVEGEGISFGSPTSSAPIAVQPSAVLAGPENVNPGKAIALPATTQGVPANSALWYSFYFDGGNDALAKVTLPYGDYNNLKFELYNPGQMAKWWEADPIGRGSASGDDLVWAGDLYMSGKYYVKVVNDNPHGVGFELKIERILH